MNSAYKRTKAVLRNHLKYKYYGWFTARKSSFGETRTTHLISRSEKGAAFYDT